MTMSEIELNNLIARIVNKQGQAVLSVDCDPIHVDDGKGNTFSVSIYEPYRRGKTNYASHETQVDECLEGSRDDADLDALEAVEAKFDEILRREIEAKLAGSSVTADCPRGLSHEIHYTIHCDGPATANDELIDYWMSVQDNDDMTTVKFADSEAASRFGSPDAIYDRFLHRARR